MRRRDREGERERPGKAVEVSGPRTSRALLPLARTYWSITHPQALAFHCFNSPSLLDAMSMPDGRKILKLERLTYTMSTEFLIRSMNGRLARRVWRRASPKAYASLRYSRTSKAEKLETDKVEAENLHETGTVRVRTRSHRLMGVGGRRASERPTADAGPFRVTVPGWSGVVDVVYSQSEWSSTSKTKTGRLGQSLIGRAAPVSISVCERAKRSDTTSA
jgi:hypothetical protein